MLTFALAYVQIFMYLVTGFSIKYTTARINCCGMYGSRHLRLSALLCVTEYAGLIIAQMHLLKSKDESTARNGFVIVDCF